MINAGLEAYQSPDGRYAFLYPTGWTRVKVDGGPEIIYHDLINSNETLSLVVSDVNKEVDLALFTITAKQLHSERFLLQKGLNKMSLELNDNYPPGVYFLKIDNEVVRLIKSG